MQSSLRRLAQHVQLNAANASLLPPMPLYRALLRAHRLLPIEMRSLGDDYVKAEFKRHKTADNPVHIMGFLLEWNHYLRHLQDQFEDGYNDEYRGQKMDDTTFDKMTNEQLGQLYELMHASKDVWKPVEQLTSLPENDNDSAKTSKKE